MRVLRASTECPEYVIFVDSSPGESFEGLRCGYVRCQIELIGNHLHLHLHSGKVSNFIAALTLFAF